MRQEDLRGARHLHSIARSCTCVFLRPHWSIDDPLEGCYPISLLCLGLTGKQELPVRCNDGDAVVPVVALNGRGQARKNGVAVLLTADEHLSTGIGILGKNGTHRMSSRNIFKGEMGALPSHTRGSLKYMSLLSSIVNHLFLKPSVCCAMKGKQVYIKGLGVTSFPLRVNTNLWTRLLHEAFLHEVSGQFGHELELKVKDRLRKKSHV